MAEPVGPTPSWERAVAHRPDWRDYRSRLEAVREARYNVDLDALHEAAEADGWMVDHHEAELPSEPPGPPLPPDDARASFAVARELVRHYAFPDPRLITGIYEPDGPLEGRAMLLKARFLFFTFWFGVRVADVVDGVRETRAGRTHAFGYGYTTLEGHFEQGRIRFEVHKEEATGAVSFQIDAVSRPERIRNPFHRIGFRLFGRRLQLRFARTACERMQRFTREELAARAEAVGPTPDA